MVNEMLLDILKRKIETNEIAVTDIKNADYKTAIEEWLKSNSTESKIETTTA